MSFPSKAVGLVPEERILLTPRLIRSSITKVGSSNSSIALWKVTSIGFANSTNWERTSKSIFLSLVRSPNTTPLAPKDLQTLISSFITSISAGV